MTRWDREIRDQFYDPAEISWMDFVKKHKDMRTPRGLLDLKAISKLWRKERGYDPKIKKGTLLDERIQEFVRDNRKTLKGMTHYEIVNTLLYNLDKYGLTREEAIKIADRIQRKRFYDPKSRLPKGYMAKLRAGATRVPKRWFYAMLRGIKARSDVRDPEATVRSIWDKLTPAKREDIKRREMKGERFVYDLPLPDDVPTLGLGTVRTVKPFKLGEVQVNVSPRHYLELMKSRLFQKMKRRDGSIALVKRCKSPKSNVNIFVDKR